MPAGWMASGARILPAPASNYTKGRQGQTVKAACLHIAEGSYLGSANWLVNPASGVSAHFIVSRLGEITQMVSILDTAWANGLSWNGSTWVDPEGTHVKPPWTGLTPPINPNLTTVSIEHEGHSGDVWTPAMIAADVKILQFVAATYPLTWMPHTTLIGHADISPINRARCPGPGCPFATIVAAANSGGGSTGPDFGALWGSAYAFHEGWGIETEWKRSATVLGKATSDEHSADDGTVTRHFSGGYIRYDPKTGTAVSYFARATP